MSSVDSLVTQAQPASAAVPRTSVGGSYADRWGNLLTGVAAVDFGEKRRLSRTTVNEVRRRLWENRRLLASALRDPEQALQGAILQGSGITPRKTDPQMLRCMLAEILVWCAPSDAAQAVVHPAHVLRSMHGTDNGAPDLSDEAAAATLGSLEPGDFVEPAMLADGTPRIHVGEISSWMAVTPLTLSHDNEARTAAWRQRSGAGMDSITLPPGWVCISAQEGGCCRGRRDTGAPRTLDEIATEVDPIGASKRAAVLAAARAAAASTSNTMAKDVSMAGIDDTAGNSTVDQGDEARPPPPAPALPIADGERAMTLLIGFLRKLALEVGRSGSSNTGDRQTRQEVILLLCDVLRGRQKDEVTKALSQKVPLPTDEMEAAFAWAYQRIELHGLAVRLSIFFY